MSRLAFAAVLLFGGLAALSLSAPAVRSAVAAPPAQATAEGVRVEVFEDVNVRAGPGTDYDLIGKMIAGQAEAVLGKATNGQFLWLKVVYFGGPENTGWVLSGLVRVVGDVQAVPDLGLPPTPTRPATATLEVFVEATTTPGPDAGRPPTFTPAAPSVRPTLLPVQGVASGSGAFPPALAIIVLFVMGVFAGLVSLVRSRG